MKRVREEDAERPVTEGWFKTESVWRTRGAESQLRGVTCQLYSQAAKEEANWRDRLPVRTVERGRQLLPSSSVRTSRDCLTWALSKAMALPKVVLSMGDTDALRWPLSHVTDSTDSTRALPAIINRFQVWKWPNWDRLIKWTAGTALFPSPRFPVFYNTGSLRCLCETDAWFWAREPLGGFHPDWERPMISTGPVALQTVHPSTTTTLFFLCRLYVFK